MDIDAALDFVRANDHAVLSTRRPSGDPQMSPVNAGVVDGRVCISSQAPRAKVRNLRRDPRASVLLLPDGFYGHWVQIDGPAEIVDQHGPDGPEPALDLLEATYRAIAGEHPDWADYRRAMIADDRVVIRITPERAVGG